MLLISLFIEPMEQDAPEKPAKVVKEETPEEKAEREACGKC
jgi:hypothetical protein